MLCCQGAQNIGLCNYKLNPHESAPSDHNACPCQTDSTDEPWNNHSRPLKDIHCCANRRGIYDFLLALNSNLTSIFSRDRLRGHLKQNRRSVNRMWTSMYHELQTIEMSNPKIARSIMSKAAERSSKQKTGNLLKPNSTDKMIVKWKKHGFSGIECIVLNRLKRIGELIMYEVISYARLENALNDLGYNGQIGNWPAVWKMIFAKRGFLKKSKKSRDKRSKMISGVKSSKESEETKRGNLLKPNSIDKMIAKWKCPTLSQDPRIIKQVWIAMIIVLRCWTLYFCN